MVDVAVVELPWGTDAHLFVMNDLSSVPLMTMVSNDVFILGYPKGIGTEGLPIWKRASIASEPGIDVDGHPKLLVDTATTQGMSGAPVVQRVDGAARMQDNSTAFFNEPVNKFVGIYSGRMVVTASKDLGETIEEHCPTASLEAQLGLVWKAHVIDEIIDGQCDYEVC